MDRDAGQYGDQILLTTIALEAEIVRLHVQIARRNEILAVGVSTDIGTHLD